MGFQGMFRLPKNRKFGFTPRYYDAAREDLEYRIARAKQDVKNEQNTDYVPLRGGELRRASRVLNSDRRTSNLRTLLILGILLLIAYWLFYS